MIYTPEELSRISGSRLAVPNRIYLDTKGNKYKGTINNRLEQVFTSDKNIGVKLAVDDKTESLNTYLKQLDSKYNSLIDFDQFVEEFLNSYKYAQKSCFKQFIYTGDNISQQLIYKNDSMLELLFSVLYEYTGDNLTKITITKSDNSFVLIKNLSYDINGNLTNIQII